MSAHVATSERRAKKERRQRRLRLTEAQAALSWGVILSLLALLGAIYLYQTSRIAAVGRRVQQLQNSLNEVKRLNAELERDIAEAQSLDRLQAEAIRLGFIRAQPDEVEYFVIPEYPTELYVTPTPKPTSRTKPVESMGEALWLALRASINDLMRGESP